MYSSIQTDLSQDYLRTLLASVPQPCCLIGGWSVYVIVNDTFQRVTGREYLGSRDIDIGFHFDPKWNKEQFDNSPFAKAITKIQKLGFQAESFRFVKRFHASDGHELTVEESRHLQPYDIFPLYVDVLVDSKSPERFKMAKFSVAEELLLARVFARKESLIKKLNGTDVQVPDPQLQMEMKIRSFPKRTDDDKKTKDLIDLCALILYSGFKPPIIADKGAGKGPKNRYSLAVKTIKDREWNTISTALGTSLSEAKRVANLVR